MSKAEERSGDVLAGARAFNKHLAPAFIDHVCITNGFAPPPGSPVGEGMDAGFAYCELHCGSGVTSALLAAANPYGDFHAIDPREAPLEQGRALANDASIRNVTFYHASIEGAWNKSLPMFDYISINGIYSWVPLRERAQVLSFVRNFLKPGGAVYVSYNARPGWNRLDPFRRLLREGTAGDLRRRMISARELYGKLENARAPSVLASGVTSASLAELEGLPLDVIAADYANEFAEPLYATEVISDFAAVDCTFAGPADIAESAAVLSAYEPYKSILERMPDRPARELAKDLLRDTRFRRDVFVKGGRRIAADNREMVLRGLAFALEQPAATVRYQAHVPFGEMHFDNPHARAIVTALAEGPHTLGELVNQAIANNVEPQNVAADLHALLVSGQIRPVYRAFPDAQHSSRALQHAIRTRAGTPNAVGFLPSPYGTAFAVPVPDQIFSELPSQERADEMAQLAIEKLGGDSIPETMRENILRRARAYARNARYYASLGVRP